MRSASDSLTGQRAFSVEETWKIDDVYLGNARANAAHEINCDGADPIIVGTYTPNWYILKAVR